MSLNRRRWSNELRDSVMHFQNADDSIGSANTPMISSNPTQTYNWNKWRAPNGSVDMSLMDEAQSIESALDETVKMPDSDEDSFKSSTQSTYPTTVNERIVVDNTPLQDMWNVKTSTDRLNLGDRISSLNDRITDDNTQNSDCGTLKLSSCDSSSYKTADSKSMESQMEISTKGPDSKRYFSSPVEIFPSTEPIADINEPDIWDALISLEQALSPFGEQENSEPHNHSKILDRLSQKFKETPTRFTEKLVLILEDSVISIESPSKQNQGDSSGISLNRMTGEFRKLCKFIEDECIENESMPEWAPSLMNTTTFDRANMTINTPTALKQVFTPQKKPSSSVNTPINRFTPSADKSFEYWEKLCDMMEERDSAEEKPTTISLVPEVSAKKSMDEMLTICERQMASLDDSTIEVRNSEPYKNTDSELKRKAVQPPRSKSESKFRPISHEEEYQLAQTKINARDEEFFTSNNGTNLLYENTNATKKVELDLDDSFELLNVKSRKPRGKQFIKEKSPVIDRNEDKILNSSTENPPSSHEFAPISYGNSYDDIEQDCSLLVELAQRRQRCIDTAKLMMEIDKDTTAYTSSDEDKKCLETLYKLGIQDKTFADIESDTKFLNTLNQCLEYKNYIRENNKPIMNMLQKYDSPQDLKKQAVLSMKSKNPMTQSKSVKADSKSSMTDFHRQNSKSKASLKKVQDRKMTPRFISRPLTLHKPTTVEKQASIVKPQVKSSLITTKKTTLQPSTAVSGSKSESEKSTVTQQADKGISRTRPKNNSPKVNTDPSVNTKSEEITSKTTLKVSPMPSPTLINSKRTPKSASKYLSTPETLTNKSPISGNPPSKSPNLSPRPKFFISPGKSSNTGTLGRKKPSTYFSDVSTRTPNNPRTIFDSVKSPIGLYINGTDTDLIQNVQGRINDRLLTPVSPGECGKSPKLKFNLSSKENKSPALNCENDLILPKVRYQSAKKVHLIDGGSSCSPKSTTPNSTTKKLLGPIENTLVIRHQGRIVEYSSKADVVDSETSIRFQKVAEKTPGHRRRVV
ncbi:hypothetical protein QAD02_015080 [Eretmocerus hayati]|uniref:Uncharacterized protein n=1 Tax=Eretmocerus hayati TaxID=131215 RepID=A0ACC2P851_9HYME|nr:hypothetical protein QAD02_015080 [Eretmocerus hayati]